jgi:hypothetical protein
MKGSRFSEEQIIGVLRELKGWRHNYNYPRRTAFSAL